MTVMIAIAKPFVGTEEKEAVCKVIDSGMIACGAVVEQFEKEFAAYAGTEYGIATTSGTTALEVAIRSLGIGPGDKVLTTPFSFIASTNAILYAGATPVFADIDEKTFNISVDEMEKQLARDPQIKAVLIVHLFGQACDYAAHIHHSDIDTPVCAQDRYHCYHQYTLRIKNGRRDAFTQYLADNGIGFGVFYPLSIPEQLCYKEMSFPTQYPVTDVIKNEVVSIPVHPQLTTEEVETVARVINAF